MGSRILVTGVAGLLGSHLAENLLQLGHDVRGIDNLISGHMDTVPDGIQFRAADCRAAEQYTDLLDGVEIVYHCAAAPYEGVSVFSPYFVHEHTSGATIALLSASVSRGVSRFVFCSSMARYGNGAPPFTEDMLPAPVDPYGIAKVAAELTIRSICDTHGVEYNIAVPHSVIGPRQRYDDPYRNVAAIMINRMLRGQQPIIYGDGTQRRCFSFVSDAIYSLEQLGTGHVQGEVFNIGPDEEPVTILELVSVLGDIIGFEPDPIFVPRRPLEVHEAVCSSEKARRMLGYETKTTLREGLEEMVKWVSDRGPREFDYRLSLEIVNDRTPETWTRRLL